MTDLEHFTLEQGNHNGNSASYRARDIAAIAILGPAIAGETRGLLRDDDNTMSELEATTAAVHSAISSILMREFPEATERQGLDKALEEFDNDYGGMRGGFPTPTSWIYDGRDYYQVMFDAIKSGQTQHREAMASSRYTVTLGQVVSTLLPYMDAFDEQTDETFKEAFPHFLSKAFQSVWGMLREQDTHIEHFSGIMEYLYVGPAHGNPREVPQTDGDPSRRSIYNLNFVMTEADVRRIFSEPIAEAFNSNVAENGIIKQKS